MLALAAVVMLAGCDWPTFGGDASNSGVNPFEPNITVGKVGALTLSWKGTLGGTGIYAVESAGVVYATAANNTLSAFAANGGSNCSGTPRTCSPLWTATMGAGPNGTWTPSVSDDVVYVSSGDGRVYAFDADGLTNCSGTPRTCSPLWTTTAAANLGSPAVTLAGGYVYATSNDSDLYVFDAHGVTNCSGTPKVCSPLWQASLGAHGAQSKPAVANGRVFVGSNDATGLRVFDATGVTNCAGTPKICLPLWVSNTTAFGSPAVVKGTVYIGSGDNGVLNAFDAAGSRNCTPGAPTVCSPLWSAPTNGAQSSASVSNGVVHVFSTDGNVYAFDANGSANCAGSPVVCAPLWTDIGGHTNPALASPVVANGVVFNGEFDDPLGAVLRAWDANGVTNCSGTPKVCSPLWTEVPDPGFLSPKSPAVANGWVYVTSDGGNLFAYHAP